MKKILFGVLGVVSTAAMVTASAFAVFSASATVNGINFSTGTGLVQVSGVSASAGFTENLNAGLNINGVVPGYQDNTRIWVRNASDFDVKMTARLTSAAGDWGALNEYVEVAVVPADATVADEDFKSLATWNAAEQPLLFKDDLFTVKQTRAFDVYVRFRSDAPNSLQGKSLTNITFVITGTQAVESAE